MKALRSGAGRAGRALPYTAAALAAGAAGAYPRLWERAGRRRRALARAYRALALLLCACLAREAGLTPYAVPVSTPWFLFPACYARELLAVTWMKLGL